MNTPASKSAATAPRAFAALSNRDFRLYFGFSVAAIMADNVEHVISYWVLYQKFHSPALGGFAVISHWVPHLLFAAYSGTLADRFDVRRLIQLGMLILMGVSLSWGWMFYTDTVEMWKAMLLLIAHGMAGVIWLPASQVLIHQIVRPQDLPSAVRLNATGRYIGFLIGPAVGAALLLAFGPIHGIWINSLICAPMLIWLIRAPYGAAVLGWRPPQRALRGLADVRDSLRAVAQNPVLLSMTALIGAASFFVGNAYQAQMPGFAHSLGHGRADFSYSLLLAADAAGGLVAGIVLESRSLLLPRARTAFILAMIWSALLAAFALAQVYWLAIVLLFLAGFVELAFNAMAQTLVQLNAPAGKRGSIIGVFTMSSLGLRAFSGLSIGVLGESIGIHHSLALSAGLLFLIYFALLVYRRVRGD